MRRECAPTLQGVGHGAGPFGHGDFVLRRDFTGRHQLVALLHFVDGALPRAQREKHQSIEGEGTSNAFVSRSV